MFRRRNTPATQQVVLASSVKARVGLLLDQMDRNVGDLRDILIGDDDDPSSPPAGHRRATTDEH